MKDDLIGRLRSGASMLKQAGFAFDREHRAMSEAADEIERLRARVAELEATVREGPGV